MNSTVEVDSIDDGSNLMGLSNKIMYYTSLPLLIINIIGNVLNIAVFASKRLRDTTMGFYMIFLSIADLLSSYIIMTVFMRTVNFALDSKSIFLCKFHNYIFSTLPFLAPWILVVVSADRFMAIRHPSKFPIIKTKKFQLIMMVVVVVLCFLPNIGLLLFRDITERTDPMGVTGYGCNLADSVAAFFSQLGFYYCIFLTAYVPFTLMTIFNSITVMVICRSRKKSSGNKSNLRKEKELAVILFALNILFLISYTPSCIFFLLQEYYGKIPTEKFKYHLTLFLMMLTMYLRQTHSALQFFIYLFTNRVFRIQLLQTLRLDKYIVLNNSSTSQISSSKPVKSVA